MPIATINLSSGLEEMRALRVGDPMDPATVDGALSHGAASGIREFWNLTMAWKA